MARTTLLMVAMLALAAAACGGPEVSGPEGALKEFYGHLNDGDYTEAMAMYSSEAREVIEDPEAFGDGGFDGWAKTYTKDGSISRVDVLSETPDEASAVTTLEFEIVFDDGSSKKGTVRMTEESGQWKLGLLG